MAAWFDVDAYADAAAAAVELPIAPAHRPGVILNLERIAAMARLVLDFPIGDEIDPAPVFRP